MTDRIFMKSSAAYIRQLVKDIAIGKIGIPVFQRNFVWPQSQILDLFDSIQRGYPVGSVLLWASSDPVLCKDILTDEVLELEAPPQYYVLDGRQRLTTFYGCISSLQSKPEQFKLAFNLRTNTFEYPKKEDPLSIQVSDIFDTFKMLGKLQTIMLNPAYEGKAEEYADRAKEMNTILQEYMVIQVSLEHCSLEEARIVFSRINSKGTDISRSSMLQAVTYKKGGRLLTNVIEGIKSDLIPYNFEEISEDDVLNCFFRFEDKKFYDVSMKEMESMDLLRHESGVRSVVLKAVQFLHDECGVQSYRLLPYNRQLIALTWMFKEHPTLNSGQICELKKWFMYTTSQQIFQNGSLANIRKVFNRFDLFVRGQNAQAMEYESWNMPDSLDFRFTKKSARANFMLLTLLSIYRKHLQEQEGSSYSGYVHFGGVAPACYFVTMRNGDKQEINRLLYAANVDLSIEEERMKKHCLSPAMVEEFRNGNIDGFIESRTAAIICYQEAMLRPYAGNENNSIHADLFSMVDR